MEETVLMPAEKMPRRKSFFPSIQPGSSRKSVMPNMSNVMEEDEEKDEDGPETNPIKIYVDPTPQPSTSISNPLTTTTSSAKGTVASSTSASAALTTVDDKFVVPAPPMSLKFEIHEDDVFSKPACGKSAHGGFEADETFNTQAFNIWIKSDAVSTPKAQQKQATGRQFGTLLKDTATVSPLPPLALAPASGEETIEVANAQPVSPMLRKQLSTILETSEHGTHGSSGGTNATTKSTLIPHTSPSDTETLQGSNCTSSSTRLQGVCTPGPTRLQRQMVADLSVLGEEPPAGNFQRLELWEPNAPSVPLLKSLRFQEDKTETVPRPLMACYQEDKNNSGIGTMLADFYIAWAYSYDLGGNMRKANEIFRLGIECRAEPLDELKEAHQHFGYTVAQRMMYTEGEETTVVTQELNDRRLALRSLRGQKRNNNITVGSVRTGAAVKSNMPGVVQVGLSLPVISRSE